MDASNTIGLVHAHLSEVTDIKSTASEAKPQVKVAQKHTNYEVL
jgi:hypothetical protein